MKKSVKTHASAYNLQPRTLTEIQTRNNRPQTLDISFKYGTDPIISLSEHFPNGFWKRVTSATKMNFKFQFYNEEEEKKVLTKALKEISKFHSLSSLKLTNPWGFEFDDEILLAIKLLLSRSKTLRRLQLHFGRQVFIQSKAFRRFSNAINRLTTLEVLVLTLESHGSLKDQEFASLASGLENLSHLKELHLDFSDCQQLSDQTFISLGKFLRKISCLQKLSLVFAACQKSAHEGIIQFAESLSEAQHLKQLYLNLALRAFNTESYKQLGFAISKLTKLEDLRLAFRGCQGITDELAYTTFSSFKQLSNLTKLDLNLSECPLLGDQTLMSFDTIFNNLVNLQELTLNFRRCATITSKGAEILFEALGYLTKLKRVNLVVSEIPNITNKALCVLGASIKHLTHLNNIELSLERRESEFPNEGLIAFGMGLAELKQIEKIILNFSDCRTFNNETLIKFGEKIAPIPSLKLIKINAWMTKFDKDGEKKFKKCFTNVDINLKF